MAKTQKRRQAHQHRDVSTAATVRLGIFQPTRRPVVKTWRVETPWGSASITGRLGARHLDFIECCRLVAEAQGMDGVDRYCCIVDPNKLRTAMSAGRARVEWQQMKDLATDLRKSEISDLHITAKPNFGVVAAGVLDSVLYEGVGQVPTRKGVRVGGVVRKGKRGIEEVIFPGRAVKEGEFRELWEVAFSKPFTALIGNDLPISYQGRLPQIVAVRHGVSQAVARFMLSHELGATYSLNEVLQIVGVAPGLMHHGRRNVIEDAGKLAAAGVWVAGDMVLTGATNLNPGGPNLNPGATNLNPGGPNLNPGSYRLIGP